MITFDWCIVRKDIEIDLEIEGTGYYVPGRYSGPPEYCYPEDSDAEILSVRLKDGRPLPKAVVLSDVEASDIRSHLYGLIKQGRYDGYDNFSRDD